MKKSITGTTRQSRATYEALEGIVRMKVQDFIQDIIEEEITAYTTTMYLFSRWLVLKAKVYPSALHNHE